MSCHMLSDIHNINLFLSTTYIHVDVPPVIDKGVTVSKPPFFTNRNLNSHGSAEVYIYFSSYYVN